MLSLGWKLLVKCRLVFISSYNEQKQESMPREVCQ